VKVRHIWNICHGPGTEIRHEGGDLEMTTTVAAITQFSIMLICFVEVYQSIRVRHRNVFYILAIPGILALIFGLQILGII